MPFTPGHVAAVLPLCGAGPRRSRWLVPGALVIGSMIPDLPYFVPSALRPSWLNAGLSHAATGPVTVDLVCGLLAWLTWRLLLRGPLTALAPGWVRSRLPTAPRGPSARELLAAVPSVMIGAGTHVVWDTFTHGDRWGTRALPVLTRAPAGLPVYSWLQYGSGVVGLAVVALWCLKAVHRRRPTPTMVVGRDWRPVCWLVGAAALALATVVVWVLEARAQQTWWDRRIVVAVVTRDISVAGALVVAYAVGHTGHRLWAGRRLPSRTDA